jgi:phosphoglycerate dehydrogenase-like enzyme
MRPKIAIVNSASFGKLFPEHMEKLSAFADVRRLNLHPHITPAELIPELQGLHGVISSITPRFSAEVLRSLPHLVSVVRHGIAVSNVDIKSATMCGICVSHVPGIVEREAVAEHAVCLMLSASRQIFPANKAVHKGAWHSRAQYIGVEIKDKRVGLVGFGNVGKRIAEILKKGFGCEVVAFDPFLPDSDFTESDVKRVTFKELLTTSTIISLHCSLNDSNHNCLSTEEFSLMRKGAILINTSHAELVDEKALASALTQGYLGVYATDVIEGAPQVNAEHPLLKLPNVIIVPHLGAYTFESLKGMGDCAVNDMHDIFVENKFPGNVANKDVMAKGIKEWRR